MKISNVLLSAAIIGTITIATVSTNAFAWHPKGVISKKVQNITTGSALVEADSAGTAVTAKPGDTLKYVIAISNTGASDSNGYNDMAKTVMTDTLPTGVELINNPTNRQITEAIGLVKPGQTVTKEYSVKVTANTNSTIQNTACFTGNSTANDNPQQGCNSAVVAVTVPTPVTPTTPVTPVTPAPVTPAQLPAELPHTGMSTDIFGSALVLGVVYYVLHRYISSKRERTKSSILA